MLTIKNRYVIYSIKKYLGSIKCLFELANSKKKYVLFIYKTNLYKHTIFYDLNIYIYRTITLGVL